MATNHPALAGIAFVAGLYHLINHSPYALSSLLIVLVLFLLFQT